MPIWPEWTHTVGFGSDLGSNASCIPSPRKLNAITVAKMAIPGQTASMGDSYIKSCALVSILPQLGIGGCIPNPKKLSTDSSNIIFPTDNVVATEIGETEFGRM